MSLEHVELVRRSLEAWNRGDVDAWLESAHPEIEWRSEVARRMEGSEAVYRGVAEMRRYWDEWHAVWDVVIEPTELRDAGDTVVALARVRMRGEGSGIGLETEIAYVFEFDGQLARRVRSYFDTGQALATVGLTGDAAAD
jgi:uncharacterized protein